jgi:hypothetical protein
MLDQNPLTVSGRRFNYERRRLLPWDSEKRKRLEKISRGIFAQVPVPAGVEKIESSRQSLSPGEFLRKRSMRAAGKAARQ